MTWHNDLHVRPLYAILTWIQLTHLCYMGKQVGTIVLWCRLIWEWGVFPTMGKLPFSGHLSVENLLKKNYLMLFVFSSVPLHFTIAPPYFYYFISFASTFSPTATTISLHNSPLLNTIFIVEQPIFKQQPLFSLYNFFFKLLNFFSG